MSRITLPATFLLAFALYAEASHLSLPHDEEIAENPNGPSLPYVMMLPGQDNPGTKLPLILFLHGSGLRGTDNERQLVDTEQLLAVTQRRNSGRIIFCSRDPVCIANLPMYDEKFASYVLAPQAALNTSWFNYLDVMRGVIEDSVANYNIDRRRIYVAGFSMGGFGTFDMLEAHPDLFAAGVSISGGGNTFAVESFKDVPTWLIHGENDPNVPVSSSVAMHDALVAVGADSRLSILPGREHLILNEVLASTDYSLYQWMFDQVRIPEPSSVALAILGGLLLITSTPVVHRRLPDSG